MKLNKKYKIIYADPPWRYNSATPNRKIENKYPTMSDEEIYSLNIPCEKDAVLFLWATTGKLVEGIKTIERWGFEYKSSLIWDKMILGMGYWFRGQHEFLLVGTKGKFSPPHNHLG